MDYLPIYLLIGCAVFSLFGILIYLTTERNQILDNNGGTIIDRYLESVRKTLNRSRTTLTVSQYIAIQIGCPAALAVIAFFISDDRTLMLIFMAFGFVLPGTVMNFRQTSERRKFEDEFVRALNQMSSSLHSGMTIEQAVDSVVDCELMTDSIRDDFRTLSSKMKLGTSISDAFYEYADFTGSHDVADVATAVTIMTDVGGDAGVAIEKLQKNIEDRLQYRKKRQSMLTESRMIEMFADVVPIVIIAGTYILMPGTIQSYFESVSMTIMFIVIIVLIIIGALITHAMLNNRQDAT